MKKFFYFKLYNLVDVIQIFFYYNTVDYAFTN